MTPDQEADWDRRVDGTLREIEVGVDETTIPTDLLYAIDDDLVALRNRLESRSALTALVVTMALLIGCGCGYFGRWVTEPSHAHAAP